MFFCGEHFGEAAAVFDPESSRRELGAPLPGLSLFLAAKKGASWDDWPVPVAIRCAVARLRLQLRVPEIRYLWLAGYLKIIGDSRFRARSYTAAKCPENFLPMSLRCFCFRFFFETGDDPTDCVEAGREFTWTVW